MKTLIIFFVLSIISFAQTIGTGIVDDPLSDYNVYAELTTDTLNAVLQEDMLIDTTTMDLSGYEITLLNQVTSGDTLLGEFTVTPENDIFLRVGVVATGSKRPSPMLLSKWLLLKPRMPKPQEIFIEEK